MAVDGALGDLQGAWRSALKGARGRRRGQAVRRTAEEGGGAGTCRPRSQNRKKKEKEKNR